MSRLLTKWYAEEISKYSFIHNSYMKGTYLFLEYIVNNDIKTKKIARRTSVKLLQKIIAKIKIEVGEKNNEGYKGNYYII